MHGVKLYFEAGTPIIKKLPASNRTSHFTLSCATCIQSAVSLHIPYVHFNGILQFVSPKWHHPVSFSDNKFLCISRLPRVCYMPIKFLVMQTGTKLQDEDWWCRYTSRLLLCFAMWKLFAPLKEGRANKTEYHPLDRKNETPFPLNVYLLFVCSGQ